VCPTRYRTRHFFNNSNTNEVIATKFEQEYVRCVRNEKECVCSAPNCCDTEQRSASQPGSVASGTRCTTWGFPTCKMLPVDFFKNCDKIKKTLTSKFGNTLLEMV